MYPSNVDVKEEKLNWYSKKIQDSEHYQKMIYEVGLNEQIILNRKGKKVGLKNGYRIIEFSSCSYLGLEVDQRLENAAVNAIKTYGVQFAAARTRLAPELNFILHEKLSEIFGAPSLTFSTTGLIHLAVLPLLGADELPSYKIHNKPLWIIDKTAHASIQIQRGLMSQFGDVKRVDFQDKPALEEAFVMAYEKGMTPITLSDSLGSMGGEVPVKTLFHLAEKYKGYCYIDDAHGTSILGENGNGYVLNITKKFPPRLILASSLSKAFGSNGGCLSLNSAEDIKVVKRYSIPFAFGGPLSIGGMAANIASCDIHLSGEIYQLQAKLFENVRYFDDTIKVKTANAYSVSPIRGIIVGDEEECINVCKQLFESGFYTTCAMYPTVPKNKALIRIALSAIHTKAQIKGLIEAVEKLLK